MSSDLSRLLRPRSIAVFGGQWAANVVEQCLKIGFPGEIWPVHPTRTQTHGLKTYRSADDLPAAPDAAYVGVNRHATIDIVTSLAKHGAGGAVCFASGYTESEDQQAGGRELQERLAAAAGSMPLFGPNCYGFINYLDRALLWPDQHGGAPVTSGIAIIAQSSNVAINITMQRRGLPIAYMITVGNQAQTGIAAIAQALLDDPRVTAIGLYIEGIGDVKAFEAMAANARAKEVPIIAMKTGRSEIGRQAAVTHTASMVGSAAAGKAFFERPGIPLLQSVPAFLETLKLLHMGGPLSGRSLCSMSCSGGEACIVADTAAGHHVDFRPLQPAEIAQVKATLPELVTVANPLDYHTFIWNDEAALTRTFTAMIGCGFDLSLLILDFPREDRCDAATWGPTVAAAATAARETGRRLAAVALLPENISEAWAQELSANGIVPLMGIDEALCAADAAATVGEAWAGPLPPETAPPTPQIAAPRTLNEADAKALLSAAGLWIPQSRTVPSPEQAVDAARDIGFPVVVKALGLDHKSDAGAVALDLADAQAVHSASSELLMIAPSLLVEQMVEDVVAELIVGARADPVYGITLSIGAGGIMTALLQDIRTLLLPVDRQAVRGAIQSLRLAPIFAGYRGQPAADIDAAIDAITKIADLALEQSGRIAEIEVNPLLVGPHGSPAIVADALIRIGDSLDDDPD